MEPAPTRNLQVVLDTNVLISALHFRAGKLAELWEALYQKRFQLILSPAIVGELATKLRTKFDWDEVAIRQTLRTLVRHATIVPTTNLPGVVPNDPDDEAIIAAAVVGQANVIVSGDRHLLSLKEHNGIPIVRPVDFLRMVWRDER